MVGLAAAIAELGTLDVVALQRRWRTLVGGTMPANLGRPLTFRVLAYKLQAQQLGDLDKASLRELAALSSAVKVAADEDKSRAARGRTKAIVAEGGTISAPASAARVGQVPLRVARPGTLLVREHGGVLHRVMILDEGVTWNGKTYDSLSQVALAITGTKWNGPRFFGLRDKQEGTAKLRGKLNAGANAGAKNVMIGKGRAASAGRSSSQRISP